MASPKSPTIRRQKYIRQGKHYPEQDRAFVEIQGKRTYLGKWDEPETHAAYHRLMAELVSGPAPAPTLKTDNGARVNVMTVTELCLRYLDHVEEYFRKADGSKTSEPANVKLALRPLRSLYGPTPAEDFGPMALKAVRDYMIDHGCHKPNQHRKGRPPTVVSRRYVNKQVNRIKRMFRWAAEEELISANVTTAIGTVAGLAKGKSRAVERPKVQDVPDDQVQAVKPYVSEVVWAMIQVQRRTGMRSGELVAMRPMDLTFGIKHKGVELWEYRPATHKTEHLDIERIVPLDPTCQDILRPFLKGRRTDAPLFNPQDAERKRREKMRAERKAVGGNQPDRRKRERYIHGLRDHYTRDTYRRAIARACEKAGIPAWHPHRLRHTVATELRETLGADAAQAMLGHTSINMTQHYAHLRQSKARDVAVAQIAG